MNVILINFSDTCTKTTKVTKEPCAEARVASAAQQTFPVATGYTP